MRKTRQTLKNVVGNDALKRKLLSDISSGTLSHAYIIEGKKGSGRHTVARLIAAALSCENSKNENMTLPCLECLACRKILQDRSPDVITLGRDGKASFGVDTIRFLKNDIRVVPNDLDYKVYIIEDADTMTVQAQNAFLLTLEEPPSFVKYFLLCERADSLLETIRSRAQTLRTEPISNEDIDKYICENYQSALRMKRSEPELYGELIMAAENSIGAAIELLDNKNFKRISEDRALARDFIRAVIEKRDSEKIIALTTRFDSKRDGFSEQLRTILSALRDLIVLRKSENAPLCFYYNRDEALAVTDATHLRRLTAIYDAVSNTLERISANANVRLSIIKLFSETDIL